MARIIKITVAFSQHVRTSSFIKLSRDVRDLMFPPYSFQEIIVRQRHIWNPVEHHLWSFFVKIANGLKPLTISTKKFHYRQSIGFQRDLCVMVWPKIHPLYHTLLCQSNFNQDSESAPSFIPIRFMFLLSCNIDIRELAIVDVFESIYLMVAFCYSAPRIP